MSKGYAAFELTSSRIRFIYARKEGSGYKILKADSVPYTFDMAVPDGLANAVRDILTKDNLSPQRIFVTLSLQENYIRQIIMPRMNARELDQAISSEVEKLPFFNGKSFDFVYNVSQAAKDKGSVVFAAVDQHILKYILAEFHKLGLPFEHLEIAPLNLRDILPIVESHPESQAFLVVHDRMSHLMIMRAGQYRLVYQAVIGGEELYPLNEKIDENALAGLAGELQRVLKSYLSQHRTQRLQKLWLIWDRQTAPGFEHAIHNHLGLEVSTLGLNEIPPFIVSPDEPAANPIYALTAVPLVIHLKKIKEQFPLDRFFRSLHIKRYIFKWLIISLIAVGAAFFLIGLKAWDYHQQQTKLKQKTVELRQDIERMRNESQELYRRRDEYWRIRQGLLDQATYVKTLNRVSWSQVLSVVAEEMPEDLGLTSFKFNEAGSVSFFGDALAVETIAELIRRVDDSAILKDGKFDFLSEKTVEKQRIFSFGILAQLQSGAEQAPKKP